MEEISKIPSEMFNFSWLLDFDTICNTTQPWYRIRIEVFRRVVLPEQLHAQHSEYINDNEENKSEISQGTKCGDDDAQQDLHCGPGLSQFQNTHLKHSGDECKEKFLAIILDTKKIYMGENTVFLAPNFFFLIF